MIDKTFNNNIKTLPKISDIKKMIMTDDYPLGEKVDFSLLDKTYKIRSEYTKHSFFILNHEFLKSIKKMTDDLDITSISELSCGVGWMSYWLMIYGVPIIQAVDNEYWSKGGRMNPHLDFVTKGDSIDYVINHPNIQMYILSWPYMDDVAERVWCEMQDGQYLLYIGESNGGCTADDKFFEYTHDKDVKDEWCMYRSFVSFYGIHDRPTLYKK